MNGSRKSLTEQKRELLRTTVLSHASALKLAITYARERLGEEAVALDLERCAQYLVEASFRLE